MFSGSKKTQNGGQDSFIVFDESDIPIKDPDKRFRRAKELRVE